jgi:hypothetical protein
MQFHNVDSPAGAQSQPSRMATGKACRVVTMGINLNWLSFMKRAMTDGSALKQNTLAEEPAGDWHSCD